MRLALLYTHNSNNILHVYAGVSSSLLQVLHCEENEENQIILIDLAASEVRSIAPPPLGSCVYIETIIIIGHGRWLLKL